MWDQAERRNKFVGEAGWNPRCGMPSGHLAPSSWNLPQKSGGMSAYTSVVGVGSASGVGALGLNAGAALSGSGGVTSATAQLVISMVANLAGSGTVAAADLRGYLNAVASLSGSSQTAAAMSAIAWAAAAIDAAGDITSATPFATGSLQATILSYGALTPEGIRDTVWGANAASNNVVGTMGQKLNSAASGGVDYTALGQAVWAQAVEAGLSASEVLRIVAAALAGKVSGAGTGSEVFKGLDGTTDRITSTVDASGNRTSVVTDGT